MKHVVSAMLLIVGVIHLLPLAGVLGAAKLHALYGVAVQETNLEILLRHRAVLFGLLGAFMVAAAFLPGLQLAALLMGAVSVGAFLVLAWAVGGYNDALARVVAADVIAAACLVVAAGASAWVAQRP